MAINILQGYNPSTTEPIDARLVTETSSSRYAIPSYNAYNGLIIYQNDNQKLYVLVDTGSIGNSTGWKEIGGGAGSGFPFSGSAVITGSLYVSGSGITGSLLGTASWANNSTTASYALTSAGTITNAVSASYAATASFTSPVGPTGSIQYNKAGILTGSSGLGYSNGTLTINSNDGIPTITVDDGSYITTILATEIAIGGASLISQGPGTNIYIPAGQSFTTLATSVNNQTASSAGNIILNTVPTASFITGSGVYGPYGSNSILSSSYAATASSFVLPIQNQGNTIVPYPTQINFYGAGVITTNSTKDVTVYIPGVLGGIDSTLSVNQPLTGSRNINVPNTSSFFIRTDSYPSGTFFISSSLVRLGDWSGSVKNSFIEINDASGSAASGSIKLKATNILITGSVSISGSLNATSSWANNAVTASYITSSNIVGTVLSASYAFSASYTLNSTSASYAATSSYAQTLAIQSTLTTFTSSVTVAGINTLFTQATSSYNSAFGKYTILSGSNARAGEFVTVWNSGSITYYDNSTTDIGLTLNVVFSSSFSGANILLQASASAGWTIKMLTTYI